MFWPDRYCLLFSLVVVRLFMCFGQTVLFVVIFSSSCQTLLCFGQTVCFIFSSSCQTLLCFGQTVLFVFVFL